MLDALNKTALATLADVKEKMKRKMRLVNKIRKDEGAKDVQDTRTELNALIQEAKKAQQQAEHKLQEKLDAEKKVADE